MRMCAHYLTRIRRARAHHLCAPALELCACKPRHLRVQQAVAADLEHHGEAVRAIGARLEDEQVGTARPAAAGLMKAAPPGEPSTRIPAASHHATHATCRRVSGLSCALPASDRFFLSLWMPPPPSPARLREQRAKACGGSVEEAAHHGSVLSPRV
jgi:hypothetical protein